MKNTLGDMGSGHAFDNGCTCFDSCSGVVNHFRGKKTECTCNVSVVHPLPQSLVRIVSVARHLD